MRRLSVRRGVRPPVYTIAISAGNGQSATVLDEVATDPKVLVQAGGVAAANVPVIFTATDEGSINGTASYQVITDASGFAAAPWRLGPSARTYALTARVGVSNHAVTFTATGTATAANRLLASSTTDQTATVNAAVTTPPSVQVVDAQGNPIAGQTITYAVTAGSGTVDNGTDPAGASADVDTDASGFATLTAWTLGGTAGLNTVTATGAGLTGSPVTFNANGTAAAPTQLVLISGGDQAGIVAGAALGAAIVLEVRDAGSNATEGVSVSAVPTAGGGSTPTAQVSDVNGRVSFTPTTGTTVGVNTWRFSFNSGAVTLDVSTLTTVAGVATQLVIQTQPASNGTSGVTLPGQPVIRVADANGNTKLSGTGSTASVAVAITTGDGTVSAGTPVSAVAGVATFTDMAITDVTGGANTPTYSSAGLTDAVGDPVTIAPPIPDHMVIVTEPSGATEAVPFSVSVRVTDSGGTTIPGYAGAVSIAIGTNPAAGTLSGTTTVNCVNGVGTFPNLAIDNAGVGYTLDVTGAVTGVSTSAFTVSVASAFHEPAGMTTLIDNGMDSLPSGWARESTTTVAFVDGATYVVPTTSNGVTVTNPGVGPGSTDGLVQLKCAKNQTEGQAGGATFYKSPGNLTAKSLYVRGYFKASSNWFGWSGGSCKTFQPLVNGGNRIVVGVIYGAGSGGLSTRVCYQGTVSPGSNSTYWPPLPGTGAVNRDQWHLFEALFIGNSNATADAVTQMWIDGVLCCDRRTDQILAGDVRFNNTQWLLMRGGGGGVSPDDMYLWWDNIYVSTSTSRVGGL